MTLSTHTRTVVLVGAIIVMRGLGVVCLIVPGYVQQWTLDLHTWMRRVSLLNPAYRLIGSPAYLVLTRLVGVTLIAMSALLILLILSSVTGVGT